MVYKDMDQDKKELIYRYLQEQIAQADFRVRGYVFDENNSRNPTRNCFIKLGMHLNNFLSGKTAIRWIVVSGFRGVGKTTLLAQMYYKFSGNKNAHLLYLSVDHITQLLGVSLQDVLQVYEEIIGNVFERLERPIILFLDEVQYDKQWGIVLKTVFDRSNKVFIFCTGSSALSMQTNTDIVRRAVFEKLYPMSFTEYMKVKQKHFEIRGLAEDLRKTLFDLETAEEVFLNLKKLEKAARQYWIGIERLEIDRYMKFGTLPFAVKLKNESLAYDQIKKIIDRIISMDIVELGQFRPESAARISEVLYTIASTDILSVNNLAKDLGMSRVTLTEILDVLEKTETIIRVYPHGSPGAQAVRPSKYLFASPAFRAMYYNFVGNIIREDSYRGKLLEDTVGLYLSRTVIQRNGSLTYDNKPDGADFIIRLGGENIIFEAGYGKKGFSQVENSASRIKSKYGIAVSMSPLALNPTKTALTVPLSYFLLL